MGILNSVKSFLVNKDKQKEFLHRLRANCIYWPGGKLPFLYRPKGRIFRISIPTLVFLYFIAHGSLALTFSCFYYLSKGVYETVLEDGKIQEMEVEDFLDFLNFSLATQTIVGYGDLSPEKKETRLIAAFHTFLGLILNALALGLILSKFIRRTPKIVLTKKVAYYPEEKRLFFQVWNRDSDNYVNLDIDMRVTRRVKLDVHLFEAFKTFPLSIHVNKPFIFYSNAILFVETNTVQEDPHNPPELKEGSPNEITIASLDPRDELDVLITAISTLKGDHVAVPYSYNISEIECGTFYVIRPYKSKEQRGPIEYGNFNKIDKISNEDCRKCNTIKHCPLSQADRCRKSLQLNFESVSKPISC